MTYIMTEVKKIEALNKYPGYSGTVADLTFYDIMNRFTCSKFFCSDFHRFCLHAYLSDIWHTRPRTVSLVSGN